MMLGLVFIDARLIYYYVISRNHCFVSHYTLLCQLVMQPYLNY